MNRILLAAFGFFLFNCNEKHSQTLFEEQSAAKTNITFINQVKQSGDNNVLKYPYYFNGGGVAIGDINNDGLPDIYFSGNQVSNKLYLNGGNFQFKDITDKARLAALEGWKTGVTMADVNQDGWLDIYVCRSAMGDSTLRKNLLFINNRDLTFTEKAEEYGIADPSYSSHAAFFDYDKDGDLDLFVLNHSLPKYAGLNRLLANYKNQKSNRFGSKLYQNNGGKFLDVSEKAGLTNNVLSFGLGVAISDVNQDGWPDIYVSNDFNEEDYLYINNQNGTFKNTIRDATGHVSLFSMGSDIADINNDALTDIYTLDMLPASNERIKLSSGDDNYDKYRFLVDAGFHHQNMRNMLQLNNGDGTFSEIGQLSGISNTDWSWAALFADFDLDGWKDLYVSNGYETDYTNMQFLKFTADEQLKAQRLGTGIDLNMILQKMPSIEPGNFLFRNKGDLTFEKKTREWGLNSKFKSNGAAYADIDNDGDLDLVVNVMNGPAGIYKNTSNENSKKTFLKIDLLSNNPSQNVIGTKVFCFAQGLSQMQEFEPVRGFQSAMYCDLIFGFEHSTLIDSVRILWPDDRTEVIRQCKINSVLKPNHDSATETYVYPLNKGKLFFESTEIIPWKHEAANTNDFKRQLLLPKILSLSGPKIAKGDVNKDGLEDIYVCGAKDQSGALFVQKKNGSFSLRPNQGFEKDKQCQDEDAIFLDVDKDQDLDLYVVSGGYPFESNDPLLQDRLYLNDGTGNFSKAANALPQETNAGSCVQSLDVDNDGDLDLFVGSRFIPGQYPTSPKNMLLLNDGKGHFKNEIAQNAAGLENAGMVCDAISIDINNDHQSDLIVAGEWMPLKIFINSNGKLIDKTTDWFKDDTSGWWNCIFAEDMDGDGDFDLIAGNYGTNNQFNVSASQPATLVYKDFNQDNQTDPFFCYYIDGISYPYASRDEALGQVNFLRQRFPDYTSYANKTLDQIFTPQELSGSERLKATTLKTSYWENKAGRFESKKIPVQAQFTPIHAIVSIDVDNDGDKDIIMGGNETYARVRIGKSDAVGGLLFLNDGKGNLSYEREASNQLALKGDAQDMVSIKAGEKNYLLIGVNQGKVQARRIVPNRD
ncbi:MAG: VCBS repeat-containing protein [Bacteroidetes bacterium]|nr:VCBS repeat-containing protein [Bacteroidota bacterium]